MLVVIVKVVEIIVVVVVATVAALYPGPGSLLSHWLREKEGKFRTKRIQERKGSVGVATRPRRDALFVENFAQKHRPTLIAVSFSLCEFVHATCHFVRTPRAYLGARGRKEGPMRGCWVCVREKSREKESEKDREVGASGGAPTPTAPSFPANFFQMVAPSRRLELEPYRSFTLCLPHSLFLFIKTI